MGSCERGGGVGGLRLQYIRQVLASARGNRGEACDDEIYERDMLRRGKDPGAFIKATL